jgi:alkylation response protein AidB-like acyl-CoA dehydrogenase
MNLTLDEEQLELASTVRSFLAKYSPESEVRRLMDDGGRHDPQVWATMANQLGLQGLGIPESYGGSGFGFRELCVVLEEMGRAQLVAPFLSTAVLAVSALDASGDNAAATRYLPGIAAGETVVAVAIAESTGSWTAEAIECAATVSEGGHVLSGRKTYVLDAPAADLLLVFARTDAGLGLFAVDAHGPGVTISALSTLDQTRPQGEIVLDGAPAVLIGANGEGDRILANVLDRAVVALAAEQVGGAQQCLDSAVEYAKVRVQFGKPIGSFQAIKHKCADMLLRVESARSAMYYAANLAATNDPELATAAAVAKAYCSEAFSHTAGENIQIHGGIGFTWEHPAHLYYKRAKTSEVLFGDPAYHRERLAALAGI